METSGWIQFAIYLVALALVTKPMGLYLMHVLDPMGRTWLDPVLAPVERFTYRAMVDLDSNPTKLLDIVEIGKQMLITRGSLTTFSIANDVAKYFAIVPAMLMTTFPEIAPLNIMHLSTSTSAILSAVIFNALIIIALIPLALRGVRYRPLGAAALLRRSLLL